MNVLLTNPILISLEAAKLVLEDGQTGVIEFTLFDQPMRLIVDSSEYEYDINVSVNDSVRLKENFSILLADSKGIVKEIIPDYTEDRAKVLFDEIYPDQSVSKIDIEVSHSKASILIELPLSLIERI